MQNTPDGGPESMEAIIARDMAQMRKEAEARRVLHTLRQTIQLRAERPEDDEAVQRARPEFTMDSLAIIAKLVEAVDILWAIIYASDGCVGHRQCAHSMEPWQRARDLLYRNAQRDKDEREGEMTDILIKRHGAEDTIDADVDGVFAIHETIPLTLGGWTLTHVPTGYAVLCTRLRLPCVAARAELLAGGLDWNFAKPSDLTEEHRRVGKALRKKYGHRE